MTGMKKALVTGAPGFLGSQIVRQLLDDGVAVRAMTMPGEDRTNLEGLDVEFVEGDAKFVGPKTVAVGDKTYTAKHILVAVGGTPSERTSSVTRSIGERSRPLIDHATSCAARTALE